MSLTEITEKIGQKWPLFGNFSKKVVKMASFVNPVVFLRGLHGMEMDSICIFYFLPSCIFKHICRSQKPVKNRPKMSENVLKIGQNRPILRPKYANLAHFLWSDPGIEVSLFGENTLEK